MLAPRLSSLVDRVVRSVVGSGRGVAVGCCVGGDALVLRSRLFLPFPPASSVASGPSLAVFSAFGPRGVGSWRGSSVALVERASFLSRSPGHGCVAPVVVRWWAGGDASVPLRSRLRSRSLALVSAVSSSGPGAGLVAFVSGCGGSPGTWATVSAALSAGLPVFAFPVPLSGPRPSGWRFLGGACRAGVAAYFPRSFRGVGSVSWVPAASSGVWASALRAVRS